MADGDTTSEFGPINTLFAVVETVAITAKAPKITKLFLNNLFICESPLNIIAFGDYQKLDKNPLIFR